MPDGGGRSLLIAPLKGGTELRPSKHSLRKGARLRNTAIRYKHIRSDYIVRSQLGGTSSSLKGNASNLPKHGLVDKSFSLGNDKLVKISLK